MPQKVKPAQVRMAAKAGRATPQKVILSFADEKSAKIAGALLKRQLESVGDTKVKAEVKGKKLTLAISAPSSVGAKASAFSARRLGGILQGLDDV